MKRNRFSKETLDLMTAGTMIPSCILVSWLIYKWLNHNGWVSPRWEIGFVLFGIVTGFYNFLRMISGGGKKQK
ncbi:MAG: AtpZ/AtpI family protein [Acidobacteria bacterium]|nr:AtpZ/AtpI family protein [Acidobacteriota bacterium]